MQVTDIKRPKMIVFALKILFYLFRNLYKLSIKCQSYPKSRKIDAFEQKICMRYKPIHLFSINKIDNIRV